MIDEKELKKLEKLSKLNFSELTRKETAKEMDSIIDFAKEVESAVSHKTVSVEEEADYSLREDVVTPSMPQEEILKNAPKADRGFFVIDRRMWK